jgi:hypothetical protein
MAENAKEQGESSTGGSEFKTFRVKELHPTFGVEIEGMIFPNPSEEQLGELLRAMAKVLLSHSLQLIVASSAVPEDTVVILNRATAQTPHSPGFQ